LKDKVLVVQLRYLLFLFMVLAFLNPPQGAWYVLSALGLYVTTPGTTEYVLGSPVFRHVRISRSPETYDAYYETSYEQRSAAADAAAASAGNRHFIL
jgi:hypothetical protein